MKVNKKGFTMAELLIVVAIVGILVAVSIPIFRAKLEKAKEAHDIATMRAAASAAVELYYSGVKDSATATAAGLSWWGTGSNKNAYGAYDPRTSKFYPDRDSLPAESKTYGKGTKYNAETSFVLGNDRGAYAPGEDYTQAVVMVSIYPPTASAKGHVEVYWKHNAGSKKGKYVGDQYKESIPKYSISIPLN